MNVNMLEAKTNLSKLVERALKGEEIIIARNGEPAVRLVPVRTQALRPMGLGAIPGGLSEEQLLESVAPLSEEELKHWYGDDA
jgi:prevent-host-death family protein